MRDDIETPAKSGIGNVLLVALNAFPLPDEDCPWEHILEFKAELHDKQWAFRRFLKSLTTKQLTSAEIGDELAEGP
jgi:hypothetical protein